MAETLPSPSDRSYENIQLSFDYDFKVYDAADLGTRTWDDGAIVVIVPRIHG
ncbi:hypothetical protein ABIF69_004499 [Bradyrhizobium japonicum]